MATAAASIALKTLWAGVRDVVCSVIRVRSMIIGLYRIANPYNLITMRCLPVVFAACLVLQAQIPQQDARNIDLPNTDTHFAPKVYKTLAEWQSHKEYLRKQILSAAGLFPPFPKTDLRPQIFGRIENRDYSIEKVLLETLPGYYLGGNLYRRSSPRRLADSPP
jgi:hypothetical protein